MDADGRQKYNSHVNKNVFTKGPTKAGKFPGLKEKQQSLMGEKK